MQANAYQTRVSELIAWSSTRFMPVNVDEACHACLAFVRETAGKKSQLLAYRSEMPGAVVVAVHEGPASSCAGWMPPIHVQPRDPDLLIWGVVTN